MPRTIACLSGALSAGNAVTWVLAASEFPRERIFFFPEKENDHTGKINVAMFYLVSIPK